MKEAYVRRARIARAFNDAARGFNSEAMRFLPFCADRMVLKLNPVRGAKVLDCATGTGALAAAAAQAVAPSGRAIAIDISEEMLARARKHVSHIGRANIDFFAMDAEELEFRAHYFDYTLCSYALAYLADPQAAMAGWARVTRTGGKVMVATYAKQAFGPFLDLLCEELDKNGVNATSIIADTIRGFGDSADCYALFEGAGLRDVEVGQLQLGFHLRRAEEWWSVVSFVILPALALDLAPDVLEAVKSAHLPAVARAASDEGIWLDVTTLFSVGTR